MQTTKIRMLDMTTYKPRWVDPADVVSESDVVSMSREEFHRLHSTGAIRLHTEEKDGQHIDRYVRIAPEERPS